MANKNVKKKNKGRGSSYQISECTIKSLWLNQFGTGVGIDKYISGIK